MDKFFICWVDGTDGGYCQKYTSFEVAQAEAKRLAALPSVEGKHVYVLSCVGFAVINKVTWVDMGQPVPLLSTGSLWWTWNS